MNASKRLGTSSRSRGAALTRNRSTDTGLRRRPIARAVALSLAAMAGTALAQQGVLEEIVVTAEFRPSDVQDTPIAITAISGSMMEARSQTNVFEVAAQAPNVTLKPAGASVGPAMIAFIRGIGQTDFNYALEPGVGVYVDDVYYPTLTGSLIDLLDLDRIEVLRGPQGTLAGRNSIGGAIKLYSRAPTAGGGGSVQLSYGSLSRVDVRASGDVTLVPDRLYARLAGVSRQRDGHVTRLDYRCVHPDSNVPTFSSGRISDCQLGKEGGQSYTAGRVNLSWLPSDAVTVSFAVDATNDRSQTQPNVLIRVNEALTTPPTANTGPFTFADGFQGTAIVGTDGNPVYLTNAFVPHGPYRGDTRVNDGYVNYATYLDPNAFNPDTHQRYSPTAIEPISTLNHRGVSTVIDWQISDRLALKSITSYREYTSSFAQDADASPINSQMLLQHLTHDQWGQEFRLSGTALNDRLDFTAGTFLFEQDGTLEANVNLYYVQFNFIHGPDPTPSHNYAAFMHTAYSLTDQLNISAGVRYSDDKKTYVHFRRNPDGTLPQGPCIGPPHNVDNPSNCALVGLFNEGATWEDTRWDWRVALDYRLSNQVMTYGQVSTGYKGGGVNPRPFVLPQLLPFNSETLTAYEFGFKSQLLERTMRLNGAIFYNDYTDIIMTLNPCPEVAPGPCALPINAGTAKVLGAELEMEWHPTDRVSFDASVSYLDFDYRRTVAPVQLDHVPPFTPEWQASAGIQFRFQPGDYGQISLRLDASYQDEIHTGPINTEFNRIGAYTLANARLMWRSREETWDAALEVTNLADKYYFHTLFDQFQSGGGTLSGQPGLPRMFGLTLRRHF
jgi:iron complex outermembrane recepter protein